jgi:hypothetical protein
MPSSVVVLSFDSFGHVIFPQKLVLFHAFHFIGTLLVLRTGEIFQFPSFSSLSKIINVPFLYLYRFTLFGICVEYMITSP